MPTSSLVNVRIPDAMRKELQAISRRDHVPLSDLIRNSLRTFLTLRRLNYWRKKITPYARQAGYITEEDVLQIPS